MIQRDNVCENSRRLQARQEKELINQDALVGVHEKDQKAIERLIMSSYEGNINRTGLHLNQDQGLLQNYQPVLEVKMNKKSYEHNHNISTGYQPKHVDVHNKNTILRSNNSFSEEDLIRFINGDSLNQLN